MTIPTRRRSLSRLGVSVVAIGIIVTILSAPERGDSKEEHADGGRSHTEASGGHDKGHDDHAEGKDDHDKGHDDHAEGKDDHDDTD